MNSIILRVAAKFLLIFMLLFSVFALLRGHNEPGGGFIGGLIAASAFSLYLIAYGAEQTRRLIKVDLHYLIAAGLILVLGSSLTALLFHRPFLSGLWFSVPFLGIPVGTPTIFDIGIYLVVASAALMVVLALEEKEV